MNADCPTIHRDMVRIQAVLGQAGSQVRRVHAMFDRLHGRLTAGEFSATECTESGWRRWHFFGSFR